MKLIILNKTPYSGIINTTLWREDISSRLFYSNTKKIILEALKSYKGAMLFVSHTEEFVEGLTPSRIMFLPENKIKHWLPKD